MGLGENYLFEENNPINQCFNRMALLRKLSVIDWFMKYRSEYAENVD
jgi:hypothetical protein